MRATPKVSRRTALALTGAGMCHGFSARAVRAEAPASTIELTTKPSRLSLRGPSQSDTPVWTFNGQVPGPAINAVQGERIRVVVRNDLTEPATVHWHGLRVPNEMDGVPDLTQPAIEPGEAFVYEFDLRDAGTYWYHAFFNGAEQTERGLYGALIVDERQQAGADRDIVWILDDWSLDEHGRFRPFHDRMAASHAGRLGTMVTINGRMDHIEPVRAYERIRLRLVNAANARTFGLKFDNQKPWVMAFDGQPVPPHRPPGDRVVLAAGMRADLFIDIPDRHWSTVVIDDYFDGAHYAYDLARFTYSKTPPLRLAPLPEPTMLPANPIAEPNLADAERYQIVLDGGAAGVPETDLSSGEKLYGKETVGQELYWSINGRGQDELSSARPLARLQLDRSYRFELINRTIFEHAIYLHGHKFRVVAREGRPEPHRPFRDTVLVGPKENVEIAFVADNPGRWLLHCSVREHQETGMTAVLAVR